MNRFFVMFFILPFFFAASCSNEENGNRKDINPESIYFDYKIWGQEGYDNVIVKLQYRYGGENGESILLEKSSKVELDGEVLKADSAKMTGVYYEIQKPIVTFSGKHTITFTGSNNNKYKEVFDFQPISLTKPLPAVIKRKDLIFEFKGISTDDLVRVLMTDTAFFSEEVNRVDSVKNGRLYILKEELTGLKNGPIYLEITKEYEREISKGTSEGGRLSISYGLKREFILEN
jgi:hypothetical protein